MVKEIKETYSPVQGIIVTRVNVSDIKQQDTKGLCCGGSRWGSLKTFSLSTVVTVQYSLEYFPGMGM